MPKSVFGVAFYLDDEENPIEVSHDELLALRTFGLVRWNFTNGHFEGPIGRRKEALAFLKEYRAGGAQ